MLSVALWTASLRFGEAGSGPQHDHEAVTGQRQTTSTADHISSTARWFWRACRNPIAFLDQAIASMDHRLAATPLAQESLRGADRLALSTVLGGSAVGAWLDDLPRPPRSRNNMSLTKPHHDRDPTPPQEIRNDGRGGLPPWYGWSRRRDPRTAGSESRSRRCRVSRIGAASRGIGRRAASHKTKQRSLRSRRSGEPVGVMARAPPRPAERLARDAKRATRRCLRLPHLDQSTTLLGCG